MKKFDMQMPSFLSRRELLAGAGAVALSAAAGEAMAAAHMKHDHAHHGPMHDGLLDAVNECLDTGQRCTAHCLVSFTEGDTSLAECARSVHEMQALCEAFGELLVGNSGYGKELAAICGKVCADCEKECRKHEASHAECKACADACGKLVAAIEKSFA